MLWACSPNICCRIKLKDRLPSKELRERLCIDDIALVLQQNRLRWYGHVLQKEDNDWVKKCMEYEVEGSRPKRTWREVVKEDCQARKLNTEDAMDCSKWRKLIKDVRWPGWVWVGESLFWYQPTRVVLNQWPLNGCVCVLVYYVCHLGISQEHLPCLCALFWRRLDEFWSVFSVKARELCKTLFILLVKCCRLITEKLSLRVY